MPTREELQARIDNDLAFVEASTEVIDAASNADEPHDPWSEGIIAAGKMPPEPGNRHFRRTNREAERNETEVHVERVAEESRLAQRFLDDGDGDYALFHILEAAKHRAIAEPRVADIRMRTNAKVTGAKGGANSWKPRKK